ncbi:hypothetical protein CTI12_AA630080 [Artemisia annua]|uniref:Uncharacterized protein n=1 Tax=Artemisia annua TaxID=35608 RepID=A0A2U1K9E4_ARTAN|nr:hypothetical protein CTI12_AA630080 [Artemisia annua]
MRFFVAVIAKYEQSKNYEMVKNVSGLVRLSFDLLGIPEQCERMRTDPLKTSYDERNIGEDIASFKRGACLLKYGHRGKPNFSSFFLSNDKRCGSEGVVQGGGLHPEQRDWTWYQPWQHSDASLISRFLWFSGVENCKTI